MTELTLTAFSLPTDLQPVDSPRHKCLLSAHATTRRLDECLTVSEEAVLSDCRSHCSSIHFSVSPSSQSWRSTSIRAYNSVFTQPLLEDNARYQVQGQGQAIFRTRFTHMGQAISKQIHGDELTRADLGNRRFFTSPTHDQQTHVCGRG